MVTRKQLIILGSRFPSRRLMEQADYSIALATEEGSQLTPIGWTPALTTRAREVRAAIDAQVSGQSTAKEDVPRATADVGAATLVAKTWKRKLATWASIAFEDDDVTLDDFFVGGRIGRSTPRLVEYVTKTLPLVERHTVALVAEGMPADFAAQGAAALSALRTADSTQELNIETLPQATAALYEARGTLYRMIKKLNRLGRLLHDGDPSKASRYNQTILMRAGRAAATPAAPTPAPSIPSA